jgi:hypothetical protein
MTLVIFTIKAEVFLPTLWLIFTLTKQILRQLIFKVKFKGKFNGTGSMLVKRKYSIDSCMEMK